MIRSASPARGRRSRWAVVVAMVVAFSTPARAQGPAVSSDSGPMNGSPTSDGARLLATSGARLLAHNVSLLTAGGAPKPAATSMRPLAPWSTSVHAFRDSILVSMARTAVGTRYVRGGESFQGGFDCSGLIRYLMRALDVTVPRTAAEQGDAGVALGRDPGRLVPGDLLTFGSGTRGASHVGIYVGNGRFVHASSVAGRVIESDIQRSPSRLVKAWRDTRRVLSDAGADSVARGDS